MLTFTLHTTDDCRRSVHITPAAVVSITESKDSYDHPLAVLTLSTGKEHTVEGHAAQVARQIASAKEQARGESATPPNMEYEVGPSPTITEAWNVDAINFDGDGEFYTAIFVGHRGRERAEEYAAWKNAGNACPVRT